VVVGNFENRSVRDSKATVIYKALPLEKNTVAKGYDNASVYNGLKIVLVAYGNGFFTLHNGCLALL
ncbi:hypothetical protein A2U01_0111234, partial [Trifolium medium]|nr:hypothetical protein [Trifolium medium]